MKKLCTISSSLLLFFVFISMPADANVKQTPEDEKISEKTVNIYFFHRNSRCGSCKTIENLTKKTVETYFEEELENRDVVLHIINVEQEENHEIAKKYNARATAIHITVKTHAGEESKNLTTFARSNARDEDAFMSGLKEHIEKGLTE